MSIIPILVKLTPFQITDVYMLAVSKRCLSQTEASETSQVEKEDSAEARWGHSRMKLVTTKMVRVKEKHDGILEHGGQSHDKCRGVLEGLRSV